MSSLDQQLSRNSILSPATDTIARNSPVSAVPMASAVPPTAGFGRYVCICLRNSHIAPSSHPTRVPPVGSSDAHPPLPSFQPSPYAPNGGSLVGPEHPIFGDTHRAGYPPGYDPGYSPGFIPGGVPGGIPGQIPYPRYDPIVPTGPRGPIPRGLPRGLHPGEPNPDHLRPPNNLFDR